MSMSVDKGETSGMSGVEDKVDEQKEHQFVDDEYDDCRDELNDDLGTSDHSLGAGNTSVNLEKDLSKSDSSIDDLLDSSETSNVNNTKTIYSYAFVSTSITLGWLTEQVIHWLCIHYFIEAD